MTQEDDLSEIRAQGERAEAAKVSEAQSFMAILAGTLAWIGATIFLSILADRNQSSVSIWFIAGISMLFGILVGVWVNGILKRAIEITAESKKLPPR